MYFIWQVFQCAHSHNATLDRNSRGDQGKLFKFWHSYVSQEIFQKVSESRIEDNRFQVYKQKVWSICDQG